MAGTYLAMCLRTVFDVRSFPPVLVLLLGCGPVVSDGSGFDTDGEPQDTDTEGQVFDELDQACRLSENDNTPSNPVKHQCGGLIQLEVTLEHSSFFSGTDYYKYFGQAVVTDPYETPDVMACCEPLAAGVDPYDQPHHIACHDNAAQHVCNNLQMVLETMKVDATASQAQDLSVLQTMFDTDSGRQACIDTMSDGLSASGGADGIINASASNRRFTTVFELTDPPYDTGTNRVFIEIGSGTGVPPGEPGVPIFLPAQPDPCDSPSENMDEPYAGVGDGVDDFSLDPSGTTSTSPSLAVIGPNYSGGGPMEGASGVGAPSKLRLESPAAFDWIVKELAVRSDSSTLVSNSQDRYAVDNFQLVLAAPEEAIPHGSNPDYFYFAPDTVAFVASGVIDGVPFVAPAVNTGWVAFARKPTTWNPTIRFTMSDLEVRFVDPNSDTWDLTVVVKEWTE